MNTTSPHPPCPTCGASRSLPPRKPAAPAGFGAPGEDFTVRRIDLNEALIRHPQATFVMRAAGNAMLDAGIADGNMLLVDRSLQAKHGHVVIAALEGELVCRRLHVQGGRVKLVTANEQNARQKGALNGEAVPLEIWGVVTAVIKQLSCWP